ncbi:MAG: response regulator [Alphaproteobacteria bacterium]|nr:MAG: response regulator [Alphaproteobacteria bacterium]
MSRILLAEDDDHLRPFLARALENAGHEVIAFRNAEDTLPVLEAGQIDLLISDIVMPGMNGMELARRARARRLSLPVVFITGFAAVSMEQLETMDGVKRVLSKPFHLNTLVETVEEILEKKAAC